MWNPPIALSPEEQKIAARTQKARKFFVFLRTIRHELLDADFQQTLAKSYSPEPGGKAPVDAGVLALATLLQAYCHVSDQDAVELTVMDKRWQMVLDCLGAEHPPFSRGHAVPLSPAAHRAQPGQDVAGSDGRLGGADRGIRRPATARRPGLHPAVRCRPGGGHVQPARPCAAEGRGPRGQGAGHVRRGPHGRRGPGAGGAEQSQSRAGSRLGGTHRTGKRAAPGPGGGGAVETLARAAATPLGAGAAHAGGAGDHRPDCRAGYRARPGGGTGRAAHQAARGPRPTHLH